MILVPCKGWLDCSSTSLDVGRDKDSVPLLQGLITRAVTSGAHHQVEWNRHDSNKLYMRLKIEVQYISKTLSHCDLKSKSAVHLKDTITLCD